MRSNLAVGSATRRHDLVGAHSRGSGQGMRTEGSHPLVITKQAGVSLEKDSPSLPRLWRVRGCERWACGRERPAAACRASSAARERREEEANGIQGTMPTTHTPRRLSDLTVREGATALAMSRRLDDLAEPWSPLQHAGHTAGSGAPQHVVSPRPGVGRCAESLLWRRPRSHQPHRGERSAWRLHVGRVLAVALNPIYRRGLPASAIGSSVIG